MQIKSYLAGNPPLKIKLNDDLIIGKRDNPYGGGVMDAGEKLACGPVLRGLSVHLSGSETHLLWR